VWISQGAVTISARDCERTNSGSYFTPRNATRKVAGMGDVTGHVLGGSGRETKGGSKKITRTMGGERVGGARSRDT